MSQTQGCLWEYNRCHKHRAAYGNIVDVTKTGLSMAYNICQKHKDAYGKIIDVTYTELSMGK